jgi:hypothetical protein
MEVAVEFDDVGVIEEGLYFQFAYKLGEKVIRKDTALTDNL